MTVLITHLIVEFAKSLPGFTRLLKEDQIILLKVSSNLFSPWQSWQIDIKQQSLSHSLTLNLIKPTISLEMPVPSQGHYSFQFSGCWLILSVYIIMSFDFPFVRLLGVR